jgi:hypothetical protein
MAPILHAVGYGLIGFLFVTFVLCSVSLSSGKKKTPYKERRENQAITVLGIIFGLIVFCFTFPS